MKTWISAVFALSVLGMAPVDAEPVKGNAGKQEVPAADIGVKTDIIGLLGRPLGEMMTVTATCDPGQHAGGPRDGKASLGVIRVTGVNGRDLSEPVDIVPVVLTGEGATTREVKDFPIGRFECRGCEMGGFENMSSGFLEENEQVGSSFQSGGAFGFYTSFVLVRAPGPPGQGSLQETVAEKPAVGDPGRRRIFAAEIGKQAVIVGYLGVPVGQVVTLTATLDPARQPEEPKIPENETSKARIRRWLIETPKILRVLKVDGKELPEPVEMRTFSLPWDGERHFPAGEPFEVRGCETGGIRQVSEEFAREYAAAGGSEVLQKGPLRFQTIFTLLHAPRR